MGGEEAISKCEKDLLGELEGFETYDPWNHDYSNGMSDCVLSLKIALWALYWSFQNSYPKYLDDGAMCHAW